MKKLGSIFFLVALTFAFNLTSEGAHIQAFGDFLYWKADIEGAELANHAITYAGLKPVIRNELLEIDGK